MTSLRETPPEPSLPGSSAQLLAVLRAPIEEWLSTHLTPHRVGHSQRVGQTARQLAERFGADPDLAELAGLLHDVAREWAGSRLLEVAHAAGWPVGYLEELTPMPCLHGAVGARLARDQFGVADEAVLQAIARHTLGAEDMSLMDQVLFVADAIEPGRGDAPYLADLRQAADTDLAFACRRAYDHTFDYLLRTAQPIHPDAVRGRNWLLFQEQRARRPAPSP
ncbi:MAG: bis(5'-nucleosyl)-tetraphosphatase (symmetrical) YqeK [Candidatus Sericytochromatia bacterium]|nr:bis(5'-nucleosyl)-tetraphosphatase (symmetrical) YqeK [Candidatus Sericytochromatia bacterium]